MKLTWLDCGNTHVSDLSPLKDMKLTTLNCCMTRVSDLSPLKDMPLASLNCQGARVPDLSPLKGMPLKDIFCSFKADRDAEVLRSIKTLQTINNQPAAEVLKIVTAEKPLDEAWLKEVAALPAKQQVEAVIAKMKERNPGFDGSKVTHQIEGGVVTEFRFEAVKVNEIGAVRALSGLQALTCTTDGPGMGIADLSPLKGMKLKELMCRGMKGTDLTPLADMPLASLDCCYTQVSDLRPLKRSAADEPGLWL